MLVYPKTTLALLYLFLFTRIWYIQGYLSFRGYNKAQASEDFSKFFLLMFVVVSITSSLSLCGARFTFLKRFLPKRFK